MCRAQNSLPSGSSRAHLRCNCDSPAPRRDRQNLANAVNRAEASTTVIDGPRPEPEVVEEAPTENVLHQLVRDPESYKRLISEAQAHRNSYESDEAWILDGKENTPENYAAGLAARSGEIRAVGEIVAARSDAIHGVDLDAVRTKVDDERAVLLKELETLEAPRREQYRFMGDLYDKYKVKFLSPNAEVKLRLKLDDDDKAKLETLEENGRKDIGKVLTVNQRLRQIAKWETPELQEIQKKVQDANRQAVAEIRSVGNENIDLNIRVRKDKDEFSGKVASEIGSVFPDDWVRKSNELGQLDVVVSANRAHYMPLKGEGKLPYSHYMKDETHPDDSRFEGWVPRAEEDGTHQGKTHGPQRDFLADTGYRTRAEKKKFNEDGTPKGTGWKRGTAYQKKRNGMMETGEWTRYEGWVRDNPTDQKRIKEATNGIGVLRLHRDADDAYVRSTIVHEFSHRMEDSHKTIGQFEQHWIVNRTTDEEGKREPLRSYFDDQGRMHSNEKLRPDNFVHKYMGKDYNDPHFHELLSVSSESLFNGSMGGFEGMGMDKTDRDTKSYVLGMYAVL